MSFSVIVILFGICSGWLLFRKLRFLLPLQQQFKTATPSISVIIPARNEEHNLPNLLHSLSLQTVQPLEIICVDDDSSDNTAVVAKAYNTKVLRVTHKPNGWMGKSYACHLGASAAEGTLLLFLDADVCFDKTTLERLIHTWEIHGPVVSVQPWHACIHFYEHCCLFFNLIAAATLSTPPLLGRATEGLFGPVILMPAALYKHCGGHEAVKGSILDDISLGRCLYAHGIQPYCCQGGQDLRYRMYPKGAGSMVEGWTKNFASGAGATRLNLWVLIVAWVAALISTPFELLSFIFIPTSAHILLFYLFSYFLLCTNILYIGIKIGKFSPLLCLFYPVPLCVFVFIFFLSVFKKLFRIPIFWKGRDVSTGR